MKKRQLMILTLFVSGLTGSIPVIKAQEWRLMSREEIEAKVHPVLLEQAGEFLHFDTCRLSVGTLNEKKSAQNRILPFSECKSANHYVEQSYYYVWLYSCRIQQKAIGAQ